MMPFSDGICGRHLHIMVKTRGLGCDVGRVVGRGLGKGNGDDSDGAPQRRRLTASTRRQRVPVIVTDDVAAVPTDSPVVPEAEPVVVGDESMVDAGTQDTGSETDSQDIGAEDAADEAEGFPGGPRDPSMLTEYAEHVAASLWSGEERLELKLSSHGRKVHKLGMPVPTIEEMVARTRLSHLIACLVDTGDRGLIFSFVERWHRETSTFHLPVGEVSITLDDITSLFHLSIVGDFHAFQPLHINEAMLMLVELLMVSPEVVMAKTVHCCGPYVHLSWVRDIYQLATRAYLLHLLGCTLFTNKSATHVHVVFLDALRDLTQTRRYVWGAVGLVHMYNRLNDASISISRQVAECNADPNYDEVSPRACRWIATKKIVKKISTAMYRQRLDHLRIPNVCWMPYAEHRSVQEFHLISCFSGQLRWGPVVVRYRPKRVMRQFRYVQCIPAHPVDSWVSFDDVDDRWTHYSDHLAPAGDICVMPLQCAPDYID
ncbi:Protein MAIN-LIKE 1 [Glycine max]|nr:Protein MAIN-LIKE 1 [Glycine max]